MTTDKEFLNRKVYVATPAIRESSVDNVQQVLEGQVRLVISLRKQPLRSAMWVLIRPDTAELDTLHRCRSRDAPLRLLRRRLRLRLLLLLLL